MKWWYSWLMVLAGLPMALGAPVVVVQGNQATPNAAERAYAGRVTGLVADWLSAMAVDALVLNDTTLTYGKLKDTRVLLLPYNPHPPPEQMDILERFVARGGRLIVCYGGDARLARLMQVKLGDYKADPLGTRWTRIRFGSAAPPGVPEQVRQVSRSLRPVHPERGGEILAWWEDAAGQRREPAWVRTPTGYWMTHVLRDDGDTWAKQRMLVALLASLDPAWLAPAAARSVNRAETLQRFDSFDQTLSAIRARAGGALSGPDLDAALATASAQKTALGRLMATGRHADALRESETLYTALSAAYAMTLPPLPEEARGVWDHGGVGLYPGDWPATMRALTAGGITDLYVDVLWPGQARFESRVTPAARGLPPGEDNLAAALKAAQKAGIRLHAWKVCWNLDAAPPEWVAELAAAGRLQQAADGTRRNWLCPSHPDNLRVEKDAIRDLLQRYNVSGIHLDYIRYPDGRSCYCAGCRQRFEAALGRSVSAWPAGVRSGPLKDRYAAWRTERITTLVRDMSAFARRMRPDILLSAAVFGRYPSCLHSVGQDWKLWIDRQYLDYVVPMNYTPDIGRFAAWVGEQGLLAGDPRRISVGIGVTAAESRLNMVDVVQQIEQTRRAGMRGFVLFDLNTTLASEFLPYLSVRPRP